MILLAGDYKTTEGARSRNGGPGAMTVSTAVGRVLTGSSPPVTLWFLSGDTERNPPRRAEPAKNNIPM